MSSLRAVFLGPPGAGKGTQAQRVAGELELVHLSTGDLLRAAVASGTEAGRAARSFMDAGRLVPDEVVFGVLFERLAPPDGRVLDRFVLDGFPRNEPQAAELDRRLRAAGTALDVVVDIAVPDERIVARITGRRVCRECGATYHVAFMPSAERGVCDACGGETQQRSDDTEATVRERLAVYRQQTRPLIAYYRKAGLLASIDGDREPEAVTEDIVACLAAAATSGGGA